MMLWVKLNILYAEAKAQDLPRLSAVVYILHYTQVVNKSSTFSESFSIYLFYFRMAHICQHFQHENQPHNS